MIARSIEQGITFDLIYLLKIQSSDVRLKVFQEIYNSTLCVHFQLSGIQMSEHSDCR